MLLSLNGIRDRTRAFARLEGYRVDIPGARKCGFPLTSLRDWATGNGDVLKEVVGAG